MQLRDQRSSAVRAQPRPVRASSEAAEAEHKAFGIEAQVIPKSENNTAKSAELLFMAPSCSPVAVHWTQ